MNRFKKDTKQLSIFTTAGYPKIDSLPHQLLLLQEYGIDFVEVGMPFSDPLADGPVIQESSKRALQNGMNINLLFEQLNSIKDKIHIPIVLMGYFNPILQFGVDRFLKEASNCGVKALIVPDLPFEIFQRSYISFIETHHVSYIPLITPNSSNEHIEQVAKVCKNGFVYLVSQNATTGKQVDLESNRNRYNEIKKFCGDTPLFMGFGIREKKDIQAVYAQCDGAIIGSAFIQALDSGKEREFLDSITRVDTETL
jgi:tryptophan synthase alpha chain